MKNLIAILITAVCYTKMDMKNGICWALCRQDGYDTGTFQAKRNICICGNVKEFKEYTDKIIKVEPKRVEEDDPWDRFFR